MKYFLFFILLSLTAVGQEKLLTETEARKYIQNAELVETYIYYETEELFDLYAKRYSGDIIVTSNEIFEVIGVESVTVVNCGLLLLEMGPAEKQTKQKITDAFKKGASFAELTAAYGKDFTYGADDIDLNIHDNLLEAHQDSKPGDSFFVDYPEAGQFYFLVVNSHLKKIKLVKVLHVAYK